MLVIHHHLSFLFWPCLLDYPCSIWKALARLKIWSILYCLSLVLKNTTKEKLQLPGKNSCRIFLVSWLSFCLIISAAYTGNLISFMTFSGQESSINTSENILKSVHDIENYDYGGVDHVAFEATQNTCYQEIWRKKSLVKSVGPSMEKVIQGDT